MIKKLLIILLLIPLTTFSIKAVIEVSAQTTEDESEKVDDLQDQIDDYEKKIDKLQGQSQTLSREIDTANTQINLTALKISNSIKNIEKKEREISRLSGDIKNLVERIEQLVERIDYQKDILKERIRERYKTRETSPLMILFGTKTINNLVKKAAYLKVMEIQDNKVLSQMRSTQKTYNRQKNLFVEKKEEEEDLQAQLIQEKANLDAYNIQLQNKKAEKARLLEITQNDEQKFQELLAKVKKELQQIIGAVSVLKNQGSTDVDKGDLIGYQGSSGYSTGDHLHYGVYKYSSFEEIEGWNWYYDDYVDPAKKLKSKTVYWDDGCSGAGNKSVGNGDWAWPMDSPTISQGYGYTCWQWILNGGNVHPAYDMWGSYGSPVYASDDGEAYFCDNCLGDGANGVFIFHDDGYMTIYWHLQ